MTFAPEPAFAYGAGRRPFASIQNLPTSVPSDGFRKIVPFFPSFTSHVETTKERNSPPFSENIVTCQPHTLEPSMGQEDPSLFDTSMASIYSQDNPEPHFNPRRNSVKDKPTRAVPSVVAEDKPPSPVDPKVRFRSLRRVRTVNRMAGLAMKERRRKGELDLPILPTESLQHLAVLIRQRREAAERFHKF